VYLRELKVRYCCREVGGGRATAAGRITTPREAAALLGEIIGSEAVEVCGLLLLTTKRDLIAYHELSRGTVDQTLLHARDVYRAALLANAPAVIVAHNHPSGDPTPSPDDRAVTTRLKASADILGIELADHVIVTATGQYFSFRESAAL
jgi:DNA repair protein RadC